MRILFLISILTLSACTSVPNEKKVKTEFGQLAYQLSGQAKPTLILESGLGDDMTSWHSLMPLLDSKYQVFRYNRAGFSGSYSQSEQRNGAVIVSELTSALTRLGLKPPYVLIGHSLGGGYMELFAKTYPTMVAGMVLIDPNSSQYPKHCQRQGLDFCQPPSSVPLWASWFLPKAVTGEIKGFAQTHEQINSMRHLPQVPVVVLSAQATRVSNSDKQQRAGQLYLQMHKEMAEQSILSKHVICETCGHYIHQEQPELVMDAITWVLAHRPSIKAE